jgi:hypothetical protein
VLNVGLVEGAVACSNTATVRSSGLGFSDENSKLIIGAQLFIGVLHQDMHNKVTRSILSRIGVQTCCWL